MKSVDKVCSVFYVLLLSFQTVTVSAAGCPAFEVELPRPHGGPVISAVDFGLDAKGERNASAITRALAEAKRVGAQKVLLAPGTYRCFDEPGVVIDGFRIEAINVLK